MVIEIIISLLKDAPGPFVVLMPVAPVVVSIAQNMKPVSSLLPTYPQSSMPPGAVKVDFETKSSKDRERMSTSPLTPSTEGNLLSALPSEPSAA